jgi:hypothetical protein
MITMHRRHWLHCPACLIAMVLGALGAAISVADADPASAGASSPAAPAPIAVPTGAAGATLTADQAQSALAQYLALRDQLVEERRLALLQAATLPDLPSKLKILGALHASQEARLAQLREFKAQVMEYNQGRLPSALVKPASTAP